MINVTKWMSWESGIDLAACTSADLQMPNLIIHVARMVHTPAGNAASGMILWQPNSLAVPEVFGFVSTDAEVGKYFGPNIFADTPFEQAPVLNAQFTFTNTATTAHVVIDTSTHKFELTMGNFSLPYLIDRKPSAMPPFYQQGVEMEAGKVEVKINGQAIDIIMPPIGISGGPAATFSPNGTYAR